MSCHCTGCTCHKSQQGETHEERFPWKRLVLSAALLLAGLACRGTIQVGLFVTAYLICGASVLVRSVRNIRKGEIFDENFLMSVATLGALLLKEYPEAVCVMLFYQIGEALQDRAAGRSRARIVRLLSLRPSFARTVVNGKEEQKDPQTVTVGEIIRVRAGERVPLDGVICKGNAQADLSALTGESRPVTLKEEQEIWAGSVCLDGVLEIRVTKNYQNSAMAKILQLTEQAAEKKSSTEKFITRFARIYTPIVVGSAVVLALIPPLVIPGETFSTWVSRALVFLVVSCPCALVLSVPLSFFGGLGGAARHGILIKGSSFLERLARLHTLALDKTGTLTQGIFEILSVTPQPGFTQEQLLTWAAQAEAHSNHPIAKAIVRARQPEIPPEATYRELAGQGIELKTAHETILAGNDRLMRTLQLEVPQSDATSVYVAHNGQWAGTILLGDPLKKEACSALAQLRQGLVKRIVILSGDSTASVRHTAQEASIGEFYGELLPADKVAKFEELLHQTPRGFFTAFAGDGINDAPVLARADVSIAMGALGADAAIETADVVLMTDELTKLVTAVRMARYTLHIVRENVGLALGVKAVVLVLGTLGYAHLWMAVFADVGISLICVANTLRTMYYRG